MSLINQMLRDLDARRGPASRVETAALQGMGLAGGPVHEAGPLLRRAGWVTGLLLAGILIRQGYQSWSAQRTQTVLPAPAVTVPLAKPVQAVMPVSTEETTVTLPSPTPAIEPLQDQRHTPPVPIKKPPPPTAARKPLTSLQQAQRRFSRAQHLLTNGRLRAASTELETVLELDPARNDARLQLAALYLRHGRVDRAGHVLEDGHRLKADDARIATAYARLLADQGHYKQALLILDNRLQNPAVAADTLALAAGLHYRLQQFAASVSRYRNALALRPEQNVWRMGLGISLEHKQQPAEALIAYRRVNLPSLAAPLQHFITGRITALTGRTD